MKTAVDDHLNLLIRSLGDRRLIVFTGMSGSGKSTYIELLLAEHPDFADRDYTWIGPAPIAWPVARQSTELVVIDEVSQVVELWHVTRLLREGHTLLVASHLPFVFVRLLALRWPLAHFRTDQSIEKLEHSLALRGILFTSERVRDFVRSFGANYTDLEIVLERSDGKDFDRALDRFERSASIRRMSRAH